MSNRKYTTRKGEFADMTVDQLKELNKQLANEVKACKTVLKQNENDEEAKNLLKETTHKRIRLYKRLRELGYSSKSVRVENAKSKKAGPSPATEPAPIEQSQEGTE